MKIKKVFRDILERKKGRNVVQVVIFTEVVLEASVAPSLRQDSLQIIK